MRVAAGLISRENQTGEQQVNQPRCEFPLALVLGDESDTSERHHDVVCRNALAQRSVFDAGIEESLNRILNRSRL